MKLCVTDEDLMRIEQKMKKKQRVIVGLKMFI